VKKQLTNAVDQSREERISNRMECFARHSLEIVKYSPINVQKEIVEEVKQGAVNIIKKPELLLRFID
jgi:hypothetical protein